MSGLKSATPLRGSKLLGLDHTTSGAERAEAGRAEAGRIGVRTCMVKSGRMEDVVSMYLLLEENRNKKRKYWIHPINQKRNRYGEYHHLFHEVREDEERFYAYLRMKPNSFDALHEILKPRISKRTTGFRRPIGTEERLVVTLRFLATGVSFRSLSFSFRLGVSTVAGIVKETCLAIWECRGTYLPAPTRESFEALTKEFYQRWNFPNTIGCIDGKHIQLKCPSNSRSNYFNYKKFFSIVLQAIAGPDMKFTFMDAGAYGKESDGGIFARSKIKHLLDINEFNLPATVRTTPNLSTDLPFFLLGDAAYPLRKDLITPYISNRTHEKRVFNYRHSRCRRCVESAFGILAGKWRVLLTAMEVNVDNAITVVLATIVLHNFVLSLEGAEPDEYEDWIDDHSRRQEPRYRGRPAGYASWIRDQLKDYVNGTGAVPWQDDKV